MFSCCITGDSPNAANTAPLPTNKASEEVVMYQQPMYQQPVQTPRDRDVADSFAAMHVTKQSASFASVPSEAPVPEVSNGAPNGFANGVGSTSSRRLGTNNSLHSHRSSSGGGGPLDRIEALLEKNKAWSKAKRQEDPQYFQRLCNQQTPEYLWIGCADSRVPANTLLNLEPGEVFVQRNVGNQAHHTDMNCMTCLEYAVNELKVKTIIVCGHYNCGAVKGALKLPSKTQGLVNCWISDIRECRNQHHHELRTLPESKQVDRLCELNVIRQAFHVCTSPVVQAAWGRGQDLTVYGVVYSLENGLLKKLVGPLSASTDFSSSFHRFESNGIVVQADRSGKVFRVSSSNSFQPVDEDVVEAVLNTKDVAERVAQHIGWSEPPMYAPTTPSPA